MCSIGTINAEGKLFGNEYFYVMQMNKHLLDILCIQDTGLRKLTHLSNTFSFHEYTLHYIPPSADDKAGGMAIVTKDTISNIVTVANVANKHQTLTCPSPFDLVLHNVYCKAADKRSAEYIASIPISAKTLIAGDLNSWSNPSMDLCSTSKLRNNPLPITQLLKQGMVDPYRELFPTKFAYSKWGAHTKKSGDLVTSLSRIDYILTHKSLYKKVVDSIIIQDQVIDTDHRLVILKLDLNTMPNRPPPPPITIRKNIKDKTLWKEKYPTTVLPVDNSADINTLANTIKNTLTKALDEVFSTALVHPNQAKRYFLTSPTISSLKAAKKSAYRLQHTIILNVRHNKPANHIKFDAAYLSLCSHSLKPVPALFFNESDLSRAKVIENRMCTLIGRKIRKLNCEAIKVRVTEILKAVDLDAYKAYKLLHKQSTPITCLLENDTATVDHPSIKAKLNKTWTGIFKSHASQRLEYSKFLKYMPKPPPATKLPTLNFSFKHLKSILATKAPTSPGESKVTWKMLKHAPDHIIHSLSALYQKCYDANQYPSA